MKRVIGSLVAVLVLVALVLAAFPFPVMAQGAADINPDLNPDLEIWISETGEARLCAGPLLCFDSGTLDTILADYQTGVSVPSYEGVYKLAREYNIDVLSLHKKGQVLDVGANGKQLASLQVEEVVLEELLQLYLPLPAFGSLLQPWLAQGDLAVVVYFGDQPGDLVFEGMAGFPEPKNFLEFGMTISPAGEVVSLAGLQPSQLGAEMYLGTEAMGLLEQFGVDTADLQVSGNVVNLTVNGDQWLKATLDIPQVMELGASHVPAGYEGLVDLATSWASDSSMVLHLQIADEPPDPSKEVPKIDISRPIVASLSKDGTLSVEGFELPLQVPEIAMELLGDDGVVLTLDGPAGQIRSSGELEIAADFESGFVSEAGQAYLPEFPAWEWAEKVVENTTVNLAIVPVGSTASLQPAEFVDLGDLKAAPVALNVPVSVGSKDGSIGLWGEKLPEQLGLAASPLVRHPSLRAVGFSAEGAMFDVDGAEMWLFWGETRREILVRTVDSYGIPVPFSEIIVNAFDNALELTGGRMVKVTFVHPDTVEPGFLVQAFELLKRY